LRMFATVVWALAAAVLIALIVAWSVHWTRYPERARAHAARPARPVGDRGREPGHRGRPGAARTLRRGRGRLRHAVRRADLGIRDDVAGAGRRDHGADR